MAGTLALVLVAGTLGCGFAPRGAGALRPAAEQLYLEPGPLPARLHRPLIRALEARGVEPVAEKDAATGVLTVLASDEGRRVLSVDADAVVAEYELFHRLEVVLSAADGEVLTGPVELLVRRDYRFERTRVLGQIGEEGLLREDMDRELIGLLLLLLRAPGPDRPASG